MVAVNLAGVGPGNTIQADLCDVEGNISAHEEGEKFENFEIFPLYYDQMT